MTELLALLGKKMDLFHHSFSAMKNLHNVQKVYSFFISLYNMFSLRVITCLKYFLKKYYMLYYVDINTEVDREGIFVFLYFLEVLGDQTWAFLMLDKWSTTEQHPQYRK